MKKVNSLIQVLEKNKSKIQIILAQVFYWLFAIGTALYFRDSVFETTEVVKNVLFI